MEKRATKPKSTRQKTTKSKPTKQELMETPQSNIKVMVILFAIMIAVGLFAANALVTGVVAATQTYSEAKENAADNAYNAFYDKSYEQAERNYHVKNEAIISIGNLKEKSDLEVFSVSKTEYIIRDENENDKSDNNMFKNAINKMTSTFTKEAVVWLEVPSHAVFSVNLKKGEYIIDNDRHYVLVRIPKPQVTDFTVDYNKVKTLNYEKAGVLKGSSQYGEELARENLQVAELQGRQDIINNQNYMEQSKDSASRILTSMVKQLNPDIKDLSVNIEFIEE